MKEDKDKQKENQAQQPAVDAILSQTNIDGQTVVAEHHVAGKAEEGNGKDKDKAKKAESQAERGAEDLRVFKKVIKAQAHEGDGQAPQTLTLRKILGGDILNTNFMRNQIGVLLLITFFLIIFIANRYSVQQDLIKIDKLHKELQDVKYKALSSSSELTEKSRESNVLDQLKNNKDSVLKIPSQPPYIIVVPDE